MAFAGRCVLITGASGGIGHATARKFAQEGARVALFGRNAEKLESVKADLGGDRATCFVCDVTSERDIAAQVPKALEAFGGKLDVLVNNAGVLIGGQTQATSIETFDANMNTNARGPFLMIRACVDALKTSKGNVVNVSSVTGLQSFQNSMAYCTSKAALDMMTKCAAIDFAADGVRVNSVNPGVVLTELQRRGGMPDETYAKFLERSKETHPLGRVAQPEEIADAICFLADGSKAGFVTGLLMPVDGGRVCLGAR